MKAATTHTKSALDKTVKQIKLYKIFKKINKNKSTS